MNVLDQRIKIYIINLKRSAERRDEMIRKMDLLGLEFEFFDAVDGSEIPNEIMQKIHSRKQYKKIYGIEMKRGEAGCALSHLGIYKKIESDKTDCAIILEDDIEFDKRLKHIVQNKSKIEFILKKYDLVLLGYCNIHMDYQKAGVCSYWQRMNLDGIIKVGTPVGWYWCTFGYLISFEGAQKLLQQGDLPIMQADFLTANSPYYNVKLGIIRKPIIWPGNHSDISTISESTNVGYQNTKSRHEIRINIVNRLYLFLWKRFNKTRNNFKIFILKISRRRYRFIVKINE